jgi:DNA-binding MarR family transcriptional regulator
MVSNGNVTGIIDRLVTDGLVIRTAKPNDRRTILVRLTDAGRERFDVLAQAHEMWVADLLSKLSASETEQLMALLDASGTNTTRKSVR